MLKKDATVTFNPGYIPDEVIQEMVSLTFVVSASLWQELPAN